MSLAQPPPQIGVGNRGGGRGTKFRGPGQMIMNHPEIATAEINPFRAFPGKKFVILDQLFKLAY